jgi:hypothetical protein
MAVQAAPPPRAAGDQDPHLPDGWQVDDVGCVLDRFGRMRAATVAEYVTGQQANKEAAQQLKRHVDAMQADPRPWRVHGPSVTHVIEETLVRRPRQRESRRDRRGHRRATSTRAGPDSDDGPASPAPPSRRRYVVDDHYLVVAVVA